MLNLKKRLKIDSRASLFGAFFEYFGNTIYYTDKIFKKLKMKYEAL